MKKNKKIKRLEISSFIKKWKHNVVDEFSFYSSTTNSEVIIDKEHIMLFVENLLESYDANKGSCKIYGVDIMQGFEINISSSEHLYEICKDVWDNPSSYHDYIGDSYYEFLKYLWVIDSNGNDTKLSEIISDKNELILN